MVRYHDWEWTASGTQVTNTFQSALATNGQDTFLFFLYADNLIEWVLHGAQVGVDGGDGVNYYSIPNSLTPEIINITHTSNVNIPGLWILKVDKNIIVGMTNYNCLSFFDVYAT